MSATHMDLIREWAAAQENLDIYQMNALYVGSGQRKYYCMSFWKTIACFGLQTFGIITLMVLQWEEAGELAVCEGNYDSLAFMAFFFASFVSITVAEQIRSLGDYGMLRDSISHPSYIYIYDICIGINGDHSNHHL